MATTSTWLSLNELGNIYGITSINCARALQKKGWRDTHGYPTSRAIKDGAVSPHQQSPSETAKWNEQLCREVLENTGYSPISLNQQVQQWAQLLEAIEKGSPSINVTTEQMAEDLPSEIAQAVNEELKLRGCSFRATEK